ncbi:MAG: hypothetical protein IKE03_10335 [Blautia sp.]|nr:hypothetical protein [Blautia sp.]
MKKRTFLIRILFVAVLIGIAAVMCVIGRGHTVYFDNKTVTGPDGTVYEAPYQIQVFVEDESAGKLKEGDRGMASVMGQDFKMILHITPEKDAKKVGSAVSFKLPYNMDGVIINLPALLGGAPEDVYMEEFVPAPVEEDEDEEVVVTDEFEMPSEE